MIGPPGMRMLGDFVDKTGAALDKGSELGKVSRIGVIATAGDRRDSDMRELGEIAAHHFDVVIVREDNALRGRRRGEVADLIAEGVHAAMGEGVRCKQVEIVLDETPIGTFLEIEGAPERIHAAAAALGRRPDEFIEDSYAALFFAAGGTGDMLFRGGA